MKKDDGLVLNRPRATTTQLFLSMIIYFLVVFDHVCWVIALCFATLVKQHAIFVQICSRFFGCLLISAFRLGGPDNMEHPITDPAPDFSLGESYFAPRNRDVKHRCCALMRGRYTVPVYSKKRRGKKALDTQAVRESGQGSCLTHRIHVWYIC